MGGTKQTRECLNHTLLYVTTLLNNNNITNWFIGYGTLLGIIREDSCIHGDDDVDIIIDKKSYELLKNLLIEKGFKIEYGFGINKSTNILKTKPTSDYSSVDFYMATLNENGDFNDVWEKVIWSNCFQNGKLIEREWNGRILYLPNNYETKLINRYGETWKIPQDTKGPSPPKSII